MDIEVIKAQIEIIKNKKAERIVLRSIVKWHEEGELNKVSFLGLMNSKYLLYISTSVWVLRTPNAGWNLHVLFPKNDFLGNKTVDQRSGANSKNVFFMNFAANFLLFSHFFSFFAENEENEDFDQLLGCAEPKSWSKYTTNGPA